MENFTFRNATRIIFGKDTENQVGIETARYGGKVLLHYGGGSIKKYGLYDKVLKSLKDAGLEIIELGGVQPNPRLGMVKRGIDICRKEKIDLILAVGGGSVIDSAKAIAVGVPYFGDVWDFYTGKAVVDKIIPVGVVLTIPASGSESSSSSVITNEEGLYKRAFSSEMLRPEFAILNPEITYTLPPYQTACGVSDIMAHIMERYFTTVKNVDLTGRQFC
ncbi:MAG: iron-containing alcohol dehydrogenase [Actinobacteria bacterium]|nr:iron-containing alcohol dehydrogenase [Actinomycetota bacterium]